MPVGPNLAESPRFGRIRKCSETIFYILLLFFVYPITLKTNDEILFEKYLKDYNKSYENETIYQLRFKAFKESLKNIELLNMNKSNESAKYGLTKYSDLFPEEFFANNLILKLPSYIHNYTQKLSSTKHIITRRSIKKLGINIPEKIDLREKNVTTEVQNQGSCGACWAFAVIGVVETMNALKTGNITKLSTQQMIDCSAFNYGCSGGDICSLLSWLTNFRIKIVSEEKYPLTLEKQSCKHVNNSDGIQVSHFGCNSFVNEEDIILYLIANVGPLAVSINAQSWQHYIGGTIQYHCDSDYTQLNHAVQIVGYDLTAPVPHYIIKNSWGVDFGHDGYLYIAIGSNLCGLAHEVAYLTLL